MKGISAKKKSFAPNHKLVFVLINLIQRFEVHNCLLVMNAGRIASAILGFQISRVSPCLFLQSLMGIYDVNAQ